MVQVYDCSQYCHHGSGTNSSKNSMALLGASCSFPSGGGINNKPKTSRAYSGADVLEHAATVV